MHWRRLVPWFGRGFALRMLAGVFVWAAMAGTLPAHGQMPPSAETLRLRVELGTRMRPAGIGLPRVSVQTTIKRLEHAPELQRAAELSALEEPGTLPFHLSGTLQWTSDLGTEHRGSVEEDWYTDRWSRFTVVVDGVRSRRWVLDGRTHLDDNLAAVPFGLRRLLAALFDPLGDAEATKKPPAVETMTVDGRPLRCVALPEQPPPVAGLVRQVRSVCVDAETGDLRLESAGFGFRTVWDAVRAVGHRRVATQIEVLRGEKTVARLHLQELRVAGELAPESFAADAAEVRKLPPYETKTRLMATPAEMRGDLESMDAHVVAIDDEALRRRPPAVIVRALAGRDGRLADLELLSSSDDGLRQQAVRVLRSAVYRRREWKGEPITVEGLLVMGLP